LHKGGVLIGVVATMQVKDGAQAQFEKLFTELARAVRENEPGCLLYTVGAKRGSSNEYVTIERFVDDTAVEAHKVAPYFLAASPKIGALLARRPDVVFVDDLFE
jgi:quinol monooxygenase YgiN